MRAVPFSTRWWVVHDRWIPHRVVPPDRSCKLFKVAFIVWGVTSIAREFGAGHAGCLDQHAQTHIFSERQGERLERGGHFRALPKFQLVEQRAKRSGPYQSY